MPVDAIRRGTGGARNPRPLIASQPHAQGFGGSGTTAGAAPIVLSISMTADPQVIRVLPVPPPFPGLSVREVTLETEP